MQGFTQGLYRENFIQEIEAKAEAFDRDKGQQLLEEKTPDEYFSELNQITNSTAAPFFGKQALKINTDYEVHRKAREALLKERGKLKEQLHENDQEGNDEYNKKTAEIAQLSKTLTKEMPTGKNERAMD